MIRPVTPDDVPFLMELAKERYADQSPDMAQVEAWLNERTHPACGMIFLRSENGACVAVRPEPSFWTQEQNEWHLAFLVARGPVGRRGWEAYSLMKTMLECVRNLGASFHFTSETGADLSPIAKRLGAVEDTTPAYRVEFAVVQEEKKAARSTT